MGIDVTIFKIFGDVKWRNFVPKKSSFSWNMKKMEGIVVLSNIKMLVMGCWQVTFTGFWPFLNPSSLWWFYLTRKYPSHIVRTSWAWHNLNSHYTISIPEVHWFQTCNFQNCRGIFLQYTSYHSPLHRFSPHQAGSGWMGHLL